MSELETERTLLRPIRRADAEALHAILADPEVMRYMETAPHRDVEQTRAGIESSEEAIERGELLRWAIERRADGRLLGQIVLMLAPPQPRAEIGYFLGRESWGQGYAAEAQRAVIDHAFGELAMHRLEADVHPDNDASLRSLDRLGFEREGLLRERWVVAGVASDSVILGLLAADWKAA